MRGAHGGGGREGRHNKGVLRVQKMENLNRCLMFLSTKVGGVGVGLMGEGREGREGGDPTRAC